MIKLQACNDHGTLHLQEVPGPKYTITAHRYEPQSSSQLGTYQVASQAICEYFKLLAKYDLQPFH